MKKNILKTTALFIILSGLLNSCTLFEDDSSSEIVTAVTTKSEAAKKAVLSLSVAGEGAARTALPSVSSAQEFESFDFKANNGAASITKSWTGDSEKTAYTKMTSESFEIAAGIWTLTLTAKKGGMTYTGTLNKELVAGANSIEFTLALSELSNEGKGSVEIKLSVPQSVIAVTATLCNTSENEVSDSSITQSIDLANNIVNYSAQNLPSGTYLVVFNLYADTSKTLLLGKWREYVGITYGATSKSEITIAADDLDDVYTITYELNGGTLKGNWSGNYTRFNLDSQIPTVDSVISNGKFFEGWYCDKNFSELFTKENVKGKNITLYAKWRNYKASEVAPAILNGTVTGTRAKPTTLVLEGEIAAEQLKDIVSAMKSKSCWLSLDFSNTMGLLSVGNEFRNCACLKEIVIPNTVTSIGGGAFEGCSGLTSVTIPSGVKSIEESAFYGCGGLTDLTIPFVGTSVDATGKRALFGCIFGKSSSTYVTPTKMYYSSSSYESYGIPCSLKKITVIGGKIKYGSFYGCSGLTSVTIPSGVKSIEENAFYGCSGLTSVTLPDSVTRIGVAAFSGCSGLTSVTIPNSVTRIEENAFYGCSGLTSVMIPSGVKSIRYGAFRGCCGLTSVTIPSGVTSIGWYAFYGCSGLTSVTIPNSVTSIGYYAFEGCSSLKSVYYCESLEKWLEISFESYTSNPCCNGSDLYIQGHKITDLVIPDSVTRIGKCAFYGCSGLTSVTIPSGVTSIGGDAFSGCSGLTSVMIPNSVTSIGNRAFSGCSGLTSVTIPNSVTSIGENAFYGCSGLTNVTIPSGVTRIEENAFRGCSGLTSVMIPNSVTSIGGGAFEGCSGLTSVTIPSGVTSIGWYAFYGCSGLTGVTIPNSVTSIEAGAFSGCSGLTSVTIPSGVTSVEKSAFEGCSGLTSVTLPDSVTRIGKCAFENCSELKNVYYTGTLENWLAFSFLGNEYTPCCNGAALYIQGKKITDLVIPDSVTSIGAYAFSGCSGLTSVTIPNSVKSIGTFAFYHCDGITKFCVSSLKKYLEINFESYANPVWYGADLYINDEPMPEDFVIPSDITSIPENAFRGIPNFKTVIIPDTVKSIGEGAFAGCSSLESLTIPFVGKSENENTVFGYIFGTSEYSGGYEDEISYTEYMMDPPMRLSRWGRYYIPSSLRSVTVTGGEYIPNNAFAGCKKIKTINLPVSVTRIGSDVFDGCLDLEKITIPFIGKSKTATGTDAVLGYLFGSENYIGGTCIEQAGKKYYISSSLGEVIILQGATTIPEDAFCDCKMLTSVTIPSGVTSIGDKAFDRCTGLTSVTIPSGVTSIGFDAFDGCSNLAGNLTIPDSVTSIGKQAFYGCKGIDLITVGNGVTYLPEYAFYNCQAVKIGGAVEKYEYNTFNSSLKKLYVDSWTQYWKIGFSGRGFSGIVSEDLYDLYINEKLVGGSYTIPAYVTEIPEQGFANMRKLTEITVPSTVKKIGKYAFGNCANLKKAYISSVTTMGESIFKGCSSLNSVTLPLGNSSNDVGNRNLLAYFFNDFEKDGYVEIQCWDATYYIPSSLKSVTINSKSIPDWAFAFCTSISKIIIDSSVTSIGKYAFEGCSGLTSVTISDSVKSIGEYAFHECSGLKEVNYRGYRSQWGAIHIDSDGNEAFKKVTRTYNYTGE